MQNYLNEYINQQTFFVVIVLGWFWFLFVCLFFLIPIHNSEMKWVIRTVASTGEAGSRLVEQTVMISAR